MAASPDRRGRPTEGVALGEAQVLTAGAEGGPGLVGPPSANGPGGPLSLSR